MKRLAFMSLVALCALGTGSTAQAQTQLSRVELAMCMGLDYEKAQLGREIDSAVAWFDRNEGSAQASGRNLAVWNSKVGEEQALVRTFNRLNRTFNGRCTRSSGYVYSISEARSICQQRPLGRNFGGTQVCRTVLASAEGEGRTQTVSASWTQFFAFMNLGETDGLKKTPDLDVQSKARDE